MTPATSSGLPVLPSGMVALRARLISSGVVCLNPATRTMTCAYMGVSMIPGTTALTRTPRGANAWANDRVMLSTAALDEA